MEKNLTKTSIKEISAVDLLNALYWSGVTVTKEVNSRRGLTNKTVNQEEIIVNEIADRFGFEPKDLLDKIRR